MRHAESKVASAAQEPVPTSGMDTIKAAAQGGLAAPIFEKA